MMMTMKATQNRNTLHIIPREELHRSFGGRISESDFCTNYNNNIGSTGSRIASHIVSDQKWERQFHKKENFNHNWKRS